MIAKIFTCFISKEYNVSQTVKYITTEKHYILSSNVVSKIFKKLRNIIYKYLEVVYKTELLGEENENSFFSVYESLFGHINGDQFWLLGIINNQTRGFLIEFTNSRSSASIKSFISKHVKKVNKISTDIWVGYDYLGEPQYGYEGYRHNHS